MIVNNRGYEALAKAIDELAALNALPTLSKRDEQRQANLMSQVSAIKAGNNPSEIKRWEIDRLLRASGLPRLPEVGSRLGYLDEENEVEWRKFANGEEVRATFRPPDRELRANLAGTESISYTQAAQGGTFVAQGMYDRAMEVMKQYDQVFDPAFSNAVETENGNGMPFPVWDDAANNAVQTSEATQGVEVDIANFGEIFLNAYSFRSKPVGISLELLQDSNFPLPSLLENILAMRIARGVGSAFVTGSGVASPTGLITALLGRGAGVVVAAGSSSNTGGAETGSTSIGTDDLGNLVAKLDPIYRRNGVFAMNDQTFNYLLRLRNKQGEPIWPTLELRRDGADGSRPSIWGWPIAVCPSFPTMASGNNSVAFYNPNYFVTRRVPSSMYIRRYWEKPGFVENGIVGFEMWLRCDSNFNSPNSGFVAGALIQQHS